MVDTGHRLLFMVTAFVCFFIALLEQAIFWSHIDKDQEAEQSGKSPTETGTLTTTTSDPDVEAAAPEPTPEDPKESANPFVGNKHLDSS